MILPYVISLKAQFTWAIYCTSKKNVCVCVISFFSSLSFRSFWCIEHFTLHSEVACSMCTNVKTDYLYLNIISKLETISFWSYTNLFREDRFHFSRCYPIIINMKNEIFFIKILLRMIRATVWFYHPLFRDPLILQQCVSRGENVELHLLLMKILRRNYRVSHYPVRLHHPHHQRDRNPCTVH